MNSAICKFIKLVADAHAGNPVVEFGSQLVQGEAANLRRFFPGRKYTGIDLQKGNGVDIVGDWCDDALAVQLGIASTGVVIASEILEHCHDPWKAIYNSKFILSDTGIMVLTVPFYMPIHQMPDYWRFTPQGLELLFDHVNMPRRIYFLGDLALPMTIFVLAARFKEPILEVAKKIEPHFGELPAKKADHLMYLWTGHNDYVRMRNEQTRRSDELEREFNF